MVFYVTIWGVGIWVNIGSGNDLLPGGTKPLPEPMWTNLQYGFMQFHKRYLIHQRIWLTRPHKVDEPSWC